MINARISFRMRLNHEMSEFFLPIFNDIFSGKSLDMYTQILIKTWNFNSVKFPRKDFLKSEDIVQNCGLMLLIIISFHCHFLDTLLITDNFNKKIYIHIFFSFVEN